MRNGCDNFFSIHSENGSDKCFSIQSTYLFWIGGSRIPIVSSSIKNCMTNLLV